MTCGVFIERACGQVGEILAGEANIAKFKVAHPRQLIHRAARLDDPDRPIYGAGDRGAQKGEAGGWGGKSESVVHGVSPFGQTAAFAADATLSGAFCGLTTGSCDILIDWSNECL
jgi:hypothetical protein